MEILVIRVFLHGSVLQVLESRVVPASVEVAYDPPSGRAKEFLSDKKVHALDDFVSGAILKRDARVSVFTDPESHQAPPGRSLVGTYSP